MAEDNKQEIPEMNFNLSDTDVSMAMGQAVAQETQQIQGQQDLNSLLDYGLQATEKFESPDTGEMRPFYADGTSIDTAVNESPVDAVDRLKLSFGNKQGSIKYLKDKFEDATVDSKGNFIVKDQGLWKKVDPEGTGSGDAWSRTKELLKDVTVDIAPEIAATAATLGIAIPTGGAGALAAAGAKTAGALGLVEGTRMSLGRLAGTYEATPEQAVQDIGTEMLLGLGGTFIGAGVKPAAGMIKKGFSGLAKTMSNASAATAETIANTLGPMTGAGADNVRRAFSRGGQIGQYLDDALKTKNPISQLKRTQAGKMTDFATGFRSAATQYWDDSMKQILPDVPMSFNANVKEFTKPIMDSLSAAGAITRAKKGNLQVAPLSEGLVTSLQNSSDEMMQAFGRAIQNDRSNYNVFKTVVQQMDAIPNTRLIGKQGFMRVRQAQSNITDLLGKVKSRKDVNKDMLDALDLARNNVMQSVTNVMDKRMGRDVAKRVGAVSNNYNKIMSDARPLEALHKKIVNNKMGRVNPDSEAFLDKFLSRDGSNESFKASMESAMNAFGGTKAGKNLSRLYDDILDFEAAQSFTPALRENFIQFGAPIAGASAIATGNLPALAGFAGTAAATSPRLAFRGIQAAQAFKQGFKSLPKVNQQSVVKGLYPVMEKVRSVASQGATKQLDDRSLNLIGQLTARGLNAGEPQR